MQKRKDTIGLFPCLVCGVDSGPVLSFFVWLVGGALLATILILFWAASKGKFKSKHLELKSIEAEEFNRE